MSPPTAFAAALACLVLGGCSLAGDEASSDRAPKPAARDSGRAAVQVVRTWVDRLNEGDLDGATRTFAVPVVVQNGNAPARLTTRPDVRAFNQSLPCGARFVRSRMLGPYIVATFRLTNRPGVRCDGPGGLAATAFLIRGGKIVEWRRVGVPAPDQRELPPEERLPV